jgi:hypothetical protein
MIVTKSTSKFTEEEKTVLKRIYAVRRKMEKEMEGMTAAEQVAYINNGAPSPQPRSRVPAK